MLHSFEERIAEILWEKKLGKTRDADKKRDSSDSPYPFIFI